jgi:hypothetical protein
MSVIYKAVFNSIIVLFFIQGFIFAQGTKFVHTASASNIISNWTIIDHALLNGNPDAILFVTQNWNPSGTGGIYNNAEIGVWYDGANWAIFNQDLTAIPEGAAFNVFVHSGSNDFVHTAVASNIISNWTTLDNPALNGDPSAIFLVTQNWNPGGTGGTYNTAETGVWYDGSNWAIYNQNLAAIPENSAYNVYVHSGSEDFVHTATAGNIISNWTVIDNPELNSNPNAIFFVTQNWNPGGTGGIYNDAEIGVWYDGSKWAVFNQNLAAMPEGASFNVYLASDGVTGVDDNKVLADAYQLEQNYPNPFNPATTIKYSIAENSFVTLKVYDILGNEAAELVNEEKSAGTYNLQFDGTKLSSGVYYYPLTAHGISQTKKMILMK